MKEELPLVSYIQPFELFPFLEDPSGWKIECYWMTIQPIYCAYILLLLLHNPILRVIFNYYSMELYLQQISGNAKVFLEKRNHLLQIILRTLGALAIWIWETIALNINLIHANFFPRFIEIINCKINSWISHNYFVWLFIHSSIIRSCVYFLNHTLKNFQFLFPTFVLRK